VGTAHQTAVFLYSISIASTTLGIDSPVLFIQYVPDKRMYCAVFPLSRIIYQTVLYRVVVDVIAVTIEIFLSPNLMLPASPLPNEGIPVFDAGIRLETFCGCCPSCLVYSLGESGLDHTPTF